MTDTDLDPPRDASGAMSHLRLCAQLDTPELVPDTLAELVEPMELVISTWEALTFATSAFLEDPERHRKEMHRTLAGFCMAWTLVAGTDGSEPS
jgi:hypothetical protein